jgi:amidohydrolase
VPPSLADRMVSVRRDIHAHPEVAWQETRTTALIHEELEAVGLSPRVLPRGSGLVCDVVGNQEGPLVALRADVDALPVDDEKLVTYRSTHAGVSHACGHDVHTATVLGAGLALHGLARQGGLPGVVRLVFQPAEEALPGGALHVIESGALDGVQRVYALHCDPKVDAGSVAVRPGAITAATDMLTVHVSGPGGHTARPHLTVDVVGALSDIVSRSPSLLSRRVDPRAGASLMWGHVVAGTAANVIPERGEASGTVRVLDAEAWSAMSELVPKVLREIALPWRATVEVDYRRGMPPAINDGRATESFVAAASAAIGTDQVRETQQSMGGEDFAWFLARVPGVLFRLGVRRPGSPDAADLHSPVFDVDESCIGCGARVLSAAALAAISELGTRA